MKLPQLTLRDLALIGEGPAPWANWFSEPALIVMLLAIVVGIAAVILLLILLAVAAVSLVSKQPLRPGQKTVVTLGIAFSIFLLAGAAAVPACIIALWK